MVIVCKLWFQIGTPILDSTFLLVARGIMRAQRLLTSARKHRHWVKLFYVDPYFGSVGKILSPSIKEAVETMSRLRLLLDMRRCPVDLPLKSLRYFPFATGSKPHPALPFLLANHATILAFTVRFPQDDPGLPRAESLRLPNVAHLSISTSPRNDATDIILSWNLPSLTSLRIKSHSLGEKSLMAIFTQFGHQLLSLAFDLD